MTEPANSNRKEGGERNPPELLTKKKRKSVRLKKPLVDENYFKKRPVVQDSFKDCLAHRSRDEASRDVAMYCYQPLFRRRKVKKRPPHPHRACWPPAPSCRTQGNLPCGYLCFVLSVGMCPAVYVSLCLAVCASIVSGCVHPSLASFVWFMYVSCACGHVYLCLFYGAIFFLCVKPCLRLPYVLLLVSVFVL